ncbi:hypothetical protein FB451DRAFT_1495596 [Mycena latifolia]|nr:hypothetical protein FB451DRAFT_1495596 [Mycena latifolia]
MYAAAHAIDGKYLSTVEQFTERTAREPTMHEVFLATSTRATRTDLVHRHFPARIFSHQVRDQYRASQLLLQINGGVKGLLNSCRGWRRCCGRRLKYYPRAIIDGFDIVTGAGTNAKIVRNARIILGIGGAEVKSQWIEVGAEEFLHVECTAEHAVFKCGEISTQVVVPSYFWSRLRSRKEGPRELSSGTESGVAGINVNTRDSQRYNSVLKMLTVSFWEQRLGSRFGRVEQHTWATQRYICGLFGSFSNTRSIKIFKYGSRLLHKWGRPLVSSTTTSKVQ